MNQSPLQHMICTVSSGGLFMTKMRIYSLWIEFGFVHKSFVVVMNGSI
jgi:hypothetical protein